MTLLKELNKYIEKNCLNDGTFAWRSTGKFEGITTEQLVDIIAMVYKHGR